MRHCIACGTGRIKQLSQRSVQRHRKILGTGYTHSGLKVCLYGHRFSSPREAQTFKEAQEDFRRRRLFRIISTRHIVHGALGSLAVFGADSPLTPRSEMDGSLEDTDAPARHTR